VRLPPFFSPPFPRRPVHLQRPRVRALFADRSTSSFSEARTGFFLLPSFVFLRGAALPLPLARTPRRFCFSCGALRRHEHAVLFFSFSRCRFPSFPPDDDLLAGFLPSMSEHRETCPFSFLVTPLPLCHSDTPPFWVSMEVELPPHFPFPENRI